MYWDNMVDRRTSKEGKEMCEKMTTIARGKGSKGSTRKVVHDFVIVFFVSECYT